MSLFVCETTVPNPKDRFIFAAHGMAQIKSERQRLRLAHLPLHVWEYDDLAPPLLLQEFDL